MANTMDKLREIAGSIRNFADVAEHCDITRICNTIPAMRVWADELDAILRESEAQGDAERLAVVCECASRTFGEHSDTRRELLEAAAMIRQLAASATSRTEPCFDEREIDTCTDVRQLRSWAHCMRRERDQWRNSALLLEAERTKPAEGQVDAKAWLLDVMGTWDFTVPTVAFDKIVNRIAASTPSRAETPNIGVGVDVKGDGVQVVVVQREGPLDTVIYSELHPLPRTEPAEGREAVAQVAKCAGIGDRPIFLWTYPGGLHGFLGDHPVGTKLYTTPPAGDGKPVAFRAINRNGSKGAWHDASEDAETLQKWISTGWQIEYAYAAPPAGDGAPQPTHSKEAAR